MKGRKFYPEIHNFHIPTSQLPDRGGGSGGDRGVMAAPDKSQRKIEKQIGEPQILPKNEWTNMICLPEGLKK